jgi:CubicO group peptidase (beta-lactamase class C family)
LKNKSLFVFLLITLSCISCKLFTTFQYGGVPRQSSYKHFPYKIIKNSPKVFNFHNADRDYNLGKTIGLNNKDFNAANVSLDSFVKLHKTVAFLIIRNDTILYSYYKEKYNKGTYVSSFSAVKPMISTLIGIAIKEGKINAESDVITKYLSQYQNMKGWDKITIDNLLNHTSGIKFSDKRYDPLSDNSQFYWGRKLRKDLLKLKLECEPNTKFRYSSANTLLLAQILEQVTQKSVSTYMEEKLWSKIGAEKPASWSVDHDGEDGIEKAFCCFQALPIDFAKFGKMYLDQGKINEVEVVPKEWIEYSLSVKSEGNNRRNFHNNWGLGPQKYGSFYAVGLFGQYIYMHPEKKLIIVRFGNTDSRYRPNYWQEIFISLMDQL